MKIFGVTWVDVFNFIGGCVDSVRNDICGVGSVPLRCGGDAPVCLCRDKMKDNDTCLGQHKATYIFPLE